MGRIRFLFLLSLCWLMAPHGLNGAEAAERRFALLIGNSTYKHTSPLANPAKDARLIGAALKDAGFEVHLHTDLGQKQMKRAIRDFARSLRRAGSNGVGLVYFAGHGTQVNGRNHLVPVDAQIEHEGDVSIETVEVNALLAQLEGAKSGLNIIILDACRNNPYKRGYRSTVRGLAPVKAFKGTLIAYSTAPGKVALDGDGDNSPYARALEKFMRTPGLSIESMFKKIRVEVDRQTNGKQTPWEESSLFGDFVFRAASSPQRASGGARPAGRSEARLAAETAFWNTVKDSDSPSALQSYLKTFPKGLFAELANWKLTQLKKKKAMQLAARQPAPNTKATARLQANKHAPRPRVRGADCQENYRSDGADLYCASSVLKAQADNSYTVASLLDDSNYTAWFEAKKHTGVGEWITVDFGELRQVTELRIKNGYNKGKDLFYKNGRVRGFELLFSGGQKRTVRLKDEPGQQVIKLVRAPRAHWVQLKISSVYRGNRYNDTGLNELRVVSAPAR